MTLPLRDDVKNEPMRNGYWCVFCNRDLPERGAVCAKVGCHSFGYLHVGVCADLECQNSYHADPGGAFEVNAPYGRLKDFYYRDTVGRCVRSGRMET